MMCPNLEEQQFHQLLKRDRLISKFIVLIITLVVLVITLALMLFIVTKAQALECQQQPDRRGTWTWRYIEPHEHTKCWYRGRHIIAKSNLHWPRSETDGNGNKTPKPIQTDKVQPVGDNADYNYIDAHADDPTPLVDLDEARPFGPWEERVSGQFVGAISK